jgi:hypothetical protein
VPPKGHIISVVEVYLLPKWFVLYRAPEID